MIVIEKRVEEKNKIEITTDFVSRIRSLLMFIMSHPFFLSIFSYTPHSPLFLVLFFLFREEMSGGCYHAGMRL